MAYEIPKNLQYSEKIIFNLSIEQVGWIGLFGAIIFTLFFKLPGPFEAKIIISILLACIAAGFAFFDFRIHLLTLYHYWRAPKEIGYLDSRMKQFIEIKTIEHDAVFLQNGGIKAIIQVQPINFHILSQRQKQAIIAAYKDYLNGLDFPIQIVMRTVNLELDDYLQKLEQKVKSQKKPHLLTQFKDFEAFVKKYIEENSVKNRQFYIVIPATATKNPFGTKTDPLEQLNIRVRLSQDKIKNSNLITKRLSTDELISFYATYFDGFIEAANDYQSIITQLQPEATK